MLIDFIKVERLKNKRRLTGDFIKVKLRKCHFRATVVNTHYFYHAAAGSFVTSGLSDELRGRRV